MGLPLFVVDAFTDRPFAGNPAGVCVFERYPSDEWLQHLGREMNLSETACLVRRSDGEFDLRWFTPGVEVVLCGHATLGSAHALWENGFAETGQTLTFHTRSGPLTAIRLASGEIELDFPVKPARPAEPPPGMLDALGTTAVWVGRNQFDYIVEVASDRELRRLAPDFGKLVATDCRGVIVTSRSDDPRFDFVSRFFAPGAGVNEDPVTGSAHCCLVDYWGEKLGKSEMTGYQASARGGVVRVVRRGDRVALIGRAVTVSRGQLLVPPN